MGLTIAQMKLAPNARKGAEWVQARHPQVVFTSGRRDVRDQARVMANNVTKYGRGWLFATYKPTPILSTLNGWMEQHPTVTESKLIADGFYDCLLACHSGQLTTLSRHLTGDAWDAQWPASDEEGERICADIETHMPAEYQMSKLIKREGALRVIHVQFAASVEV